MLDANIVRLQMWYLAEILRLAPSATLLHLESPCNKRQIYCLHSTDSQLRHNSHCKQCRTLDSIRNVCCKCLTSQNVYQKMPFLTAINKIPYTLACTVSNAIWTISILNKNCFKLPHKLYLNNVFHASPHKMTMAAMPQLTGFGRLLLQNIVYRQVHGIEVFFLALRGGFSREPRTGEINGDCKVTVISAK